MSFLSPEADGYKTTPAAKVRNGLATLAIAPTETVISSHKPRDTWKEQPRFKVRQARAASKAARSGTAQRAAAMRDFVM